MTDPTKPPERILRPRRCEIQYSWQEEGYDHPIRIVSDEYILASSLPGTVEQIRSLVSFCREMRDRDDSYPLEPYMAAIFDTLAAMKPEEKP